MISVSSVGSRVLFVEDDEGIRVCMSELLREEGFDIVEAESGDAAAVVLEYESFDLLLTDIRMPGSKDGIDLASHARRTNPSLPIVMISGYADHIETRLRELGSDVTLLPKPFRLQELVEVLLRAASVRNCQDRQRCRPMSDHSDNVYVWECLDQPGGYALCTNQNYLGFKAGNWRYLGDLPSVTKLADMPRDAIHAQTLRGWPMMVQIDQQGSYIF